MKGTVYTLQRNASIFLKTKKAWPFNCTAISLNYVFNAKCLMPLCLRWSKRLTQQCVRPASVRLAAVRAVAFSSKEKKLVVPYAPGSRRETVKTVTITIILDSIIVCLMGHSGPQAAIKLCIKYCFPASVCAVGGLQILLVMPHLGSTIFPFGHLDPFRTATP